MAITTLPGGRPLAINWWSRVVASRIALAGRSPYLRRCLPPCWRRTMLATLKKAVLTALFPFLHWALAPPSLVCRVPEAKLCLNRGEKPRASFLRLGILRLIKRNIRECENFCLSSQPCVAAAKQDV